MAWLRDLIRKDLSGVDKYRYGKPISELQRELGLERIVRLSSIENPWPLPDSVKRAIQTSLENVNRYPDPRSYRLRRLLARKWGVSTGEIIIGAGTESILHSLFHSIIAFGDGIVCPVPTYPLYRVAAIASGAAFVEVPVREGGTWEIKDIVDACTGRVKAVVLSNPSNPLGTFLERERMLNLAHELDSRQILLVVDEAYAEYVDDPNYLSGIELFRDIGRVVITRTFSKIYGLASLRVGYAIAPKTVADAFDKIHPVFEVSRVGQYAAHAALLEAEFINGIRLKTISERNRITQSLSEIGVHTEQTRTNFILVKHRKSDEVYEGLLREGVIVRKASDLGLDGFLRVTVGLPEENEYFLSSIKKELAKLG